MIARLIWVKFLMLKGSLRSTQESRHRFPAFVVLSGIFWVGLFRSSIWVVTEALKIQPVGELLVQKLLSITFLVFFGLLVFSNIVTVFSTFYLADELEFLMTKPVPKDAMFTARFIEALTQSAWVIFLFGAPIFFAAGVGVGAGMEYYLALIGVLIPFVAIPTALASILALFITNVLAANRTRDAMLFMGVAGFAVLFILIRSLRPERLLNPESFSSIGEMLRLLSTPSSLWLPSDWCMNVIVPLLYQRTSIDMWSLGLLVSTPIALYFVAAWLHRPLYYRGFSKAQEGRHGQSLITVMRDWAMKRTASARRTLEERLQRLEAKPDVRVNTMRELVRKDQRIFLRDASQWSQILVVVAIMVIYLVNYKYFEIAADERLLGDVGLYFFNLAACGFVVVALNGRFVYPTVSVEGRSFWLVLQAPISLERFLIGKWLGGVLPVFIVGQVLIWTSNLLVLQNPAFIVLASAIIMAISFGVSAMAVGIGAVYPQFHNPNAAKIASSFGAVIYMILGMFMVLSVLVFSFRFTMHVGTGFEHGFKQDLAVKHYIFFPLALAIPFVVGLVSIRLGAGSLRRRM
jgi:ABC-2 type transport system permease protein